MRLLRNVGVNSLTPILSTACRFRFNRFRVACDVEKPGKPDPPEITSAGKSTVSLSYKAPADDGGAEITNYVVEHREQGLAKWTRATKDTISKTSYTVTGLTANSVYEFRVAAENKAGVGPASDPSQPVAAKETVCKYLPRVILRSQENDLRSRKCDN